MRREKKVRQERAACRQNHTLCIFLAIAQFLVFRFIV